MTTTTTTRRKPVIRRRSHLDDKAADRPSWPRSLTVGTSLYAALACTSARAWTNAKRNLSFLTIHQDADSEGVMTLVRPPTMISAETLRITLRIRKARAMDNAALEALSAARQRGENFLC